MATESCSSVSAFDFQFRLRAAPTAPCWLGKVVWRLSLLLSISIFGTFSASISVIWTRLFDKVEFSSRLGSTIHSNLVVFSPVESSAYYCVWYLVSCRTIKQLQTLRLHRPAWESRSQAAAVSADTTLPSSVIMVKQKDSSGGEVSSSSGVQGPITDSIFSCNVFYNSICFSSIASLRTLNTAPESFYSPVTDTLIFGASTLIVLPACSFLIVSELSKCV